MEKKPIIINQDSEADTCRKEVTPKLYSATWSDEQILEQRTFTDGKIVVLGRKARRKKGKRADLFSEYSEGAREIIEIIISKYVDFGLDQLKPEIIQVEPISSKGNILEIADRFGGIDKFKTLINELQKQLYAA